MSHQDVTARHAGSRSRCACCGRPQRACICHWFRPVSNEVSVLILQHPNEARQPKGSLGLLAGSLKSCEVWVGAQCDESRLARWVGTAGDAALLYPPTPGTAPSPGPARVRRLVMLDATWRKSLKMLLLHPALQALPRLALQAPEPTRYRAIRAARRDDQVSTLEATVQALRQLEGPGWDGAPLLQAFDRFVGREAARHQRGAPAAELGGDVGSTPQAGQS
mgnify:CR=1 FL=1